MFPASSRIALKSCAVPIASSSRGRRSRGGHAEYRGERPCQLHPRGVRSGNALLGICLGTQVILDYSEEDNRTTCLGIIPGGEAFSRRHDGEGWPPENPPYGLEPVAFIGSHPLFDGIPGNAEFYFVHSYYPAPAESTDLPARPTTGSGSRPPWLGDNLVAVQFHPEKSGRFGAQDTGQLQPLGGQRCSVNGLSPVSMSETGS